MFFDICRTEDYNLLKQQRISCVHWCTVKRMEVNPTKSSVDCLLKGKKLVYFMYNQFGDNVRRDDQ